MGCLLGSPALHREPRASASTELRPVLEPKRPGAAAALEHPHRGMKREAGLPLQERERGEAEPHRALIAAWDKAVQPPLHPRSCWIVSSLGLSGQAWAIRSLQHEQGVLSRGSSAERSCTRVVCSAPRCP